MGGYGCCTQDSPACWGLATVLRSVNAESIIPFDWLLSSMGADVSLTDSEDYLYIVQKPIPVLVGPCALVGSVYPLSDLESINIRMEYSISGPEEVHDHFLSLLESAALAQKENTVHV